MKNLRLFSAPRAWPVRLVTTALFGLLLSGYLGAPYAAAQTPVVLSPVPKLQFFDASGRALAFGCVFSYQTLSSTPLGTFTDYSGTVQNPNPVVLTAGGFVGTGGLWLEAGLAYRLVVKSAGGTNCASGSTISTVDGIGGGTTTLTTIVPYSSTVTFTDAAQNQLFELTLSGNATSNPLTATGITPPAIVAWEITQDGSGGHSFSYPANTLGASTICSAANCSTTQSFLWDGATALAMGPAQFSTGPMGVPALYDFSLSPSSPICTDSTKLLVTGSCGSVYSVTYNGQTVAPGGSGNVNAGSSAHSLAVNEGNGSAIASLPLAAHQVAVGQTSADPVAKTVPNCTDTVGQHLNYTQAGDTISCGTSVPSNVLVSNPSSRIEQDTINNSCSGSPGCTFTYPVAFSSTPTCVVAGNNGSANIAPGSPSTTAVAINSTVATVYIICIGAK